MYDTIKSDRIKLLLRFSLNDTRKQEEFCTHLYIHGKNHYLILVSCNVQHKVNQDVGPLLKPVNRVIE